MADILTSSSLADYQLSVHEKINFLRKNVLQLDLSTMSGTGTSDGKPTGFGLVAVFGLGYGS